MSLTIKVYSDFVCPYCYLADFPIREAARSRGVAVEWMPYELRPAPAETLRPEGEYLRRAWAQAVYPTAARMGVPIQLPAVSPQPHTHLAFEGYQFARNHGLGEAYTRRVFEAFFVEGKDIGRADVLGELAGEVGLDRERFEQALADCHYREAHRNALHHAFVEAGVESVPTIVIGDQTLIGLQDRATLEAAIDAELARRTPPPKSVNGNRSDPSR